MNAEQAAAQAAMFGTALTAAAMNAQLTVLPTFADNIKEDRLTASEWLQKVNAHKEGGNWTNEQAITHFRNALRGTVVQWFTGVELLEDDLTWDIVKAAFQRDFRARPTASTVISKFPEMKQMDNENVNNYFSRCAVILTELKPKITTEGVALNMNVSAECAVAIAAVNGAHRTEHNNALRAAVTKHIFNQIAGYHVMAGFKAQIRSSLMNREADLITLDRIKAEALIIELRLEEKKKTSTNGDGSSRILSQQVNQISQSSTNEEVDAINNRWRGGNQSSHTSTNRSGIKCSHCSKPGHTEENCWSKHPNKKPKNGNNSSANGGNTGAKPKKKCTYCNMSNHTVENCNKLKKAEEYITSGKKGKVSEVNNCQGDEDCSSKN